MDLSIVPDAIWKIVYNYAIDDISDLITFDTTIWDFMEYILFPKELYLAEVLYNRIIVACAKCGNYMLLEYLMDSDTLKKMGSIKNYNRIMAIACEYGHLKIITRIRPRLVLSREILKEWLVISLKNLHFEIVSWIYTTNVNIQISEFFDKNDVVIDALSICKSEDNAKKYWNLRVEIGFLIWSDFFIKLLVFHLRHSLPYSNLRVLVHVIL